MKVLKTVCSGISLVLLLSFVFLASAAGMADYCIPDTLSFFRGEEPIVGAFAPLSLEKEEDTRGRILLFGVLPIKEVGLREVERMSLCPGGGVFGIRAPMGGALVTGLSEVAGTEGNRCPAREAGLRCGDLITAVDGRAVSTAAELSAAIGGCGGNPLSLTVCRGGKTLTLSLSPCRAGGEGVFRAGVLVKDTVAGIGTVTFYDPETGFFGGLGHGVYDGVSKEPASIGRGAVTGVGLTGVVKGKNGSPGELRGHLEAEKIGTLLSNTDSGVFGVLAAPPVGEPIPVALSREVKVGPAEIISTLADGATGRYTIEITSLRGERGSDKSFSIRVTDPALLELTGGIVQGMSGSPIIQNGKLVGAVTHVMISDPTSGYGIFIENMLSAAEMPEARAS